MASANALFLGIISWCILFLTRRCYEEFLIIQTTRCPP